MRQVIQIHVPRTAGLSMMSWGRRWSGGFQDLHRRGRGPAGPFDPTARWTYFGHQRLDQLRSCGVSDAWYSMVFKFTFVRNTWDRLVSVWEWNRRRVWRRWRPDRVHFASFDVFLRDLTGPAEPDWIKFREQQWEWLKYGVDFVGRFERLEEDWRTLCMVIGADYHRLRFANASEHRPYRDYYTPELRDLVAWFWAEEIERFGFKF